MIFRSLKFLYIIFFSLYFIETVSAADTEAQLKPVIIYHPGFKISEFAGRTYVLKGNEIDISKLVLGIEKAVQPYQDIFSFIDTSLKEQIIENYIIPECQKAENPVACENNTRQKLQSAINEIGEKLSRAGVYYPEGYQPLGSARPYFKGVKDYLQDECTQLCYSPDVSTVLFNGTEDEYQQLYEIINKKDKDCQKNILKEIEKSLYKIEFPGRCLQEKNKTHTVCKTILEHIQVIQHRVFELTEMAYGLEVLKQSAVTFCLECKFQETTSNNINFIDLLEHLEEQVQCSPLQPGQQKRVYPDRDPSLSRPYDLKREADGSYSVSLNLKFSPDGYDGPVQEKEQIHKYYLNKVQQCMDTANQKLLGPNGEKLKIIINGPKENENQTCKKGDTIDISIKSQNYRSDHRNYESDIKCPAITHEVLHLLGLCDEYKEKKRGHYIDPETGQKIPPSQIKKYQSSSSTPYEFKTAYDCRMVTTNSIMADHRERWDNVFKEEKNNSLLTEDQFNAILYGPCEEKNKLFNECSKLAYQSSIDHPDCLAKKQQCEKALTNKK